MDVGNDHPLVPWSPPPSDTRGLVPGPVDVIFADDELDFIARLRRLVLLLLVLLLLALRLLRTLRLERALLRQQAHYWHSQHQRAKERETKLQQQVQLLQAQVRDLESRLHGHKSETSAKTTPGSSTAGQRKVAQRRRGQQRGAKGPSRRNYDHLTTTHESCELPPQQCCCACCGTPLRQLRGTDDGHILEIEVRAHRRVYHRQRYERA